MHILSLVRRFWARSIRRRLMLGITLVIVAAVSAFVVALVEREKDFLHRQASEEAVSLTETLAANSVSWVLANDVQGLQELIHSLSRFPDLRYAMVLAPDGQVLAHSSPANIGLYVTDNVSRSLITAPRRVKTLVSDSTLIDVAVPVMAGDRLLGWARVGLGQERAAANLASVTRNGLAFMLAAVLVGALFAYFMAKGLTIGIGQLVATADLIQAGDRHARVQLRRHDELGKLAADFNQMLDAVEESEARFRLIADAVPMMIWVADVDGRRTDFNKTWLEFTGRPLQRELGNGWTEGVQPDDHQRCLQIHAEAFTARGRFSTEYRLRRHDGEYRWILEIGVPRFSEADTFVGYIGGCLDITERKAAEARIEHLAYYDPLTNLANRRLLLDRLQQALLFAGRHRTQGAVFFIDLDRFKVINDALGHHAGDLLLQEVAERLKAKLRAADSLSRLGGDEFIVLLTDLVGVDDSERALHARRVAEKIRALLSERYQIAGHEYQLTPSIGIALFPDGEETAAEVLKKADAAMYSAKAAGRNAIAFYDPSLQVQADKRLSLEQSLRLALERRELVLHYQGQFDADTHLIGSEVLLRWLRDGRLVSPAEFIPLAEETGLILAIGDWVLEAACQQLAHWNRGGVKLPHLSVNISPRQFRQANLADKVRAAIDASGIDPNWLTLEVTEALLIGNIDDSAKKIRVLRDSGVRFSIDDFGTGYSSLFYLRTLPIDELKIDKSFVDDIVINAKDRAIVQIIIAMAKTLRLEVVAEGVETAQQRDLLLEEGCRIYQGYLLARPEPAQDFSRRLDTNVT